MLLHAKFESQVNHFSKRIQGVSKYYYFKTKNGVIKNQLI